MDVPFSWAIGVFRALESLQAIRGIRFDRVWEVVIGLGIVIILSHFCQVGWNPTRGSRKPAWTLRGDGVGGGPLIQAYTGWGQTQPTNCTTFQILL